jgi:hypothetical protein
LRFREAVVRFRAVVFRFRDAVAARLRVAVFRLRAVVRRRPRPEVDCTFETLSSIGSGCASGSGSTSRIAPNGPSVGVLENCPSS